jgi:hypothetical protein
MFMKLVMALNDGLTRDESDRRPAVAGSTQLTVSRFVP